MVSVRWEGAAAQSEERYFLAYEVTRLEDHSSPRQVHLRQAGHFLDKLNHKSTHPSCRRHSKGRQGIKGLLVVWNQKVRVTPENKESVSVSALSSLGFKSNMTTGTEESQHQHPRKQNIDGGRNCKSWFLHYSFLI